MLGVVALLAVAQVQVGETRGAVYELDGDRPGPKMFDIVRRVSRTSVGWAATMEFRSPSGRVAVTERVEFSDDVQPVAYQRQQYQTGGRARIRVQGETIRYEWSNGEGESYEDAETTDQTLMVGPMMSAFFMRHWKRIAAGDALEFRILVPDRRTSYEFEFQKVEDVVHRGRRLARCELRLTGILGLFVGDMVFYLDPTSGDIVRYEGMVLPKVRDGDDWTDFKGLVEYDRPRPAVETEVLGP